MKELAAWKKVITETQVVSYVRNSVPFMKPKCFITVYI